MGWKEEVTPFQRKVFEAILKIPRGQTRTYAQVARAIGKPGAARAVGQALKRNRWAPKIPCHRVVASDGSLGGYSAPGSLRRKRQLLRQEGVEGFRCAASPTPRSAGASPSCSRSKI